MSEENQDTQNEVSDGSSVMVLDKAAGIQSSHGFYLHYLVRCEPFGAYRDSGGIDHAVLSVRLNCIVEA